MNTQKRICFISALIIVFSLAGFGSITFAGDSEPERKTLKGITGLMVMVRNVKSKGEKIDLTEDQLQTDAEIKLRMAGIEVLTEKQWLKKKGLPYIFITVHMKGKLETSYAYQVAVRLIQNVTLERNPDILSHAATWAVSFHGVGGKEDIRTAAKDLVDKFINAYLSVNSK